MITLIELKDHKVMPWKNGRGSTAEICIEPAHADFSKGDFLWRLSSATVGMDGPFSKFPGYDRLLFILTGRGLRLNDKDLLRHQSIMFPGEDEIACQLIDDQVEDLGLIFDRRKVRAEMTLVTLSKDSEINFATGTHFIKPLKGNFRVDGKLLPESAILKFQKKEDARLKVESYPASYLLISIFEKETNS